MKLEEIRQEVQADKSVLRFSMDAKATVLIRDYSRGGQSRIQVHAADHDFKPDEKVTPLHFLARLQPGLSLLYLQSGDQ